MALSTSLLALAACLGCVGLFYQQGIWLFGVLFLWAFAGYAFVPSYQSRLAREYPDSLGRIMAWNITGMYIGMTIGSYVGGPVYQAWGFTVLAGLCAAVALVAGLCSLRPAPRQKKTEQPVPFRL